MAEGLGKKEEGIYASPGAGRVGGGGGWEGTGKRSSGAALSPSIPAALLVNVNPSARG